MESDTGSMNEPMGLCPYCRFPISEKEETVTCNSCGVVHHRECWFENEQCTTYGCRGHAVDVSGRLVVPPLRLHDQTRCLYCGEYIKRGLAVCPECDTLQPFAKKGKKAYRNIPSASYGKRFLATLLDSTPYFISVLLLIVGAALAISEEMAPAGILLGLSFVLFIASLVYFLLRDAIGQGQSIGKRIMNLQVLDEQSLSPCTKTQSLIRNGILIGMNVMYFMGMAIESIAILMTPEGRRLGDRASRTVVIDKENAPIELLDAPIAAPDSL